MLLRAGEVVRGLAAARARRPSARTDAELARGPARLCSALGITGAMNGVDLLAPGSPVRLRRPAAAGGGGGGRRAAGRRDRRARRAVAVLARRRPDGQRLPPPRARVAAPYPAGSESSRTDLAVAVHTTSVVASHARHVDREIGAIMVSGAAAAGVVDDVPVPALVGVEVAGLGPPLPSPALTVPT